MFYSSITKEKIPIISHMKQSSSVYKFHPFSCTHRNWTLDIPLIGSQFPVSCTVVLKVSYIANNGFCEYS